MATTERVPAAADARDLFDLETHLAALDRCARPWRDGALLLATPPGQRYPYVYPRDLAAAVRTYARLAERGIRRDESFAHVESAALFLVDAMRSDGQIGQRYDLDGNDRSIYVQEDNPAHAVRALGAYLRLAETLGRDVPRRAEVLAAMERILRYGVATSYRPGVSLFYSTTTIHESQMEQGYTLWNNLAYLRALEVALERWDADGVRNDEVTHIRHLEEVHRLNVERRFVQDGHFLRRITPQGRADRRPDVTLLSPFYFGFHDLAPKAQRASATRIRRDLWDPELGLLQRYLPYAEDAAVHAHAGNGPWLAYTAILAQFEARYGDRDEARKILEAIAAQANSRGELPEHLSTRERFLDWWTREWEPGIDFQKEFDREILLPEVGFSRIFEELVHMRDEYFRLKRLVEEEGREVLRFAVPLAWCHAEFASALLDLGDAA